MTVMDAEKSVSAALGATLDALQVADKDQAAARLATRYAAELDTAKAIAFMAGQSRPINPVRFSRSCSRHSFASGP